MVIFAFGGLAMGAQFREQPEFSTWDSNSPTPWDFSISSHFRTWDDLAYLCLYFKYVTIESKNLLYHFGRCYQVF